MTFITEKISAQDIEKYGLWAIQDREYGGRGVISEWTIDRERDIYIRRIWDTREPPIDTTYSFYWKGAVLRVEVRHHSYIGEHGGPVHATVELRSLAPGAPPIWLPPKLESQREQITNDFKAAYVAKDISESVVPGAYTAYTATFK
jgi:hypothetical protein